MQKSVKGCVEIIYFYKKYFMLKKCYKEFLIEKEEFEQHKVEVEKSKHLMMDDFKRYKDKIIE